LPDRQPGETRQQYKPDRQHFGLKNPSHGLKLMAKLPPCRMSLWNVFHRLVVTDSVHLLKVHKTRNTMKTRFALLVLLFASFQALSQAVENDDMYFTSKDRSKKSLERVNKNNRIDDKKVNDEDNLNSTAINPTDSYSARNINPEYVSRSRSDSEEEILEEDGYFSNSYQPTGVNRNLYNNYADNSFYSPYYGNGGYGYNGFNSFGYGGGMGMYGMSPYYGGMGGMGMGGWGMSPGLSMSIGYGMGMGMGMGSFYGGMGYGWGMPSSYFWNRFYDPFYGYYNPYNSWAYGGGYGYYPGVIVGGGDYAGRNRTYQRRYDRSSSVNNNVADNSTRPANSTTRNGRTITSSGRTNSDAAQSQNYYQRGWRNNNTSTPTSRSQWNNSQLNNNNTSGTNGNGRSSWSNGSNNNSFNNGGFGSGNNSRNSWSGGDGGSNSRSSWSNGGSNSGSFSGGSGGGGRSTSGGGSGSGGSGGSSRGRH
jgi:hypothetical protein